MRINLRSIAKSIPIRIRKLWVSQMRSDLRSIAQPIPIRVRKLRIGQIHIHLGSIRHPVSVRILGGTHGLHWCASVGRCPVAELPTIIRTRSPNDATGF